MKAIMSDALRKIISDPQKNKALWEGISKLNSNIDNSPEKKTAEVSIDGQEYQIRLVNPFLKAK